MNYSNEIILLVIAILITMVLWYCVEIDERQVEMQTTINKCFAIEPVPDPIDMDWFEKGATK